MKKKRREKFSFGVAVGVVAFSTMATAGAIGALALKKLQMFVQRTADTTVEIKLYERACEDLLDEFEDEECEEYEMYFECEN